MVKKPKDLEAVMRDISQYFSNPPFWVLPIELKIWIDTRQNDCIAVYGKLSLNFNETALSRLTVFDILRRINAATPIVEITVENGTFSIPKTQEYANKPCEVHLDVNE